MKKLTTLFLVFTAFCTKADYWTQKADFPGIGREYPFSFSIGNKGYVGSGRDTVYNLHNDFWEYDLLTNVWSQKANLGGVPRYGSTGFSIGSNGYIGLGLDFGNAYLQDFWEYNPSNNTWTQKADFGGGLRCYATGFSIGNKGYVGTGTDNIGPFNDLWQYDPVTNTWVQKTNLSGIAREGANCFTIGIYGYIISGIYGGYWDDVWEYNSVSDTWTQKANLPFPNLLRGHAASFSICDKGFYGTGVLAPNVYTNDLWQYNSVTNTWLQKANFLGVGRYRTAYFSSADKGFIGLGTSHSMGFHNYIDFWEYTPDTPCVTVIEEIINSNLDFTISPNPAKDFLIVNYDGKEKINLTITDVNGKKIYETKLLTSNFRLPISNFQKGIYFIEVTIRKQKAIKKFVKE